MGPKALKPDSLDKLEKPASAQAAAAMLSSQPARCVLRVVSENQVSSSAFEAG